MGVIFQCCNPKHFARIMNALQCFLFVIYTFKDIFQRLLLLQMLCVSYFLGS